METNPFGDPASLTCKPNAQVGVPQKFECFNSDSAGKIPLLKRILSCSRYIMLIPVIGAFWGSLVLLLYEMIVLMASVIATIGRGEFSSKDVKVFAVGSVEAVDAFLIAIAVYIVRIDLYALFVDETIPLPKWLEIKNLEDLKGNLISVVIAVLAVLFLREAVSRDGNLNSPVSGRGALALVIAALSFFLMKSRTEKD